MLIPLQDFLQAIGQLKLHLGLILFIVLILTYITYRFAKLSAHSDTKVQNKGQRNKKLYRNRHGLWINPRPRYETSDKIVNFFLKKFKFEYETPDWIANYLQGLSTEFFGAVITTLTLGIGILLFDQYREIQINRAELIFQLRNPDSTIALEALERLGMELWDGRLQGAFLPEVNLPSADLFYVDLQGAELFDANLQGANLRNANLQEAYLAEANLQTANLSRANLLGTNFGGANLLNANLENAILDGSAVLITNSGTQIFMLEGATLPDGSIWNSETDMKRFTDPTHANFWNPCVEVFPIPWYCQDN